MRDPGAALRTGVVGLFANYAVLKVTAYYPMLNDGAALLLGMAAVWAFIDRRILALGVVGLLGAFTWPVAAPIVALLLLFPIRPLPDSDAGDRNRIALGVAAAFAAAFLVMFVRFYYLQGISVAGMGPVIPVYPPLAPIGVACATGYTALVVYVLLRPFSFRVIRAELSRLSWTHIGGAALVLVGPVLALRTFARGDALLTTAQFGKMLVLLSSARPLVSPISHVTYFGPVLVLLIPLWRSYVRVVHSWGTGVTLATLAAAIVALSPESRQSIFALPLIITPLCVAAHQARVRDRFVALTAAVAILMSQIWIPINTSAPAVMVDPGANMRAVYARYFMSQGPYMDNAEYAVHVLAVAIVALVLVLAGLGAQQLIRWPARRPCDRNSDALLWARGGYRSSDLWV